jgi:hypothetical protein
MSGPERRPRGVHMSRLEFLWESLGKRDWAIIHTIYRVRLATGLQLERIHFSNLTVHARNVSRSRVLKRLVDAEVLTVVEQQTGTPRYGVPRRCYTLGSSGRRVMRWWLNMYEPLARVRRPFAAGDRFMPHALAVTELYTELVERSRSGDFEVAEFRAEAPWPDGQGGLLQPDALALLRRGATADYWWCEVDLATQSRPKVREKLLAYLDFYQRGQLGPDDTMPLVIFGVPSEERRAALSGLVDELPSPAALLFRIALLKVVPQVMISGLREE